MELLRLLAINILLVLGKGEFFRYSDVTNLTTHDSRFTMVAELRRTEREDEDEYKVVEV